MTLERILQLSPGSWGSKTLLGAVGAWAFPGIGRPSACRGGVAEEISSQERGECDFYDALVALGMLEKRGGKYAAHAGHRPVPRQC